MMLEEIRSAIESVLQKMGEGLLPELPRLVGAVLLLAAGFIVARIIRSLIKQGFARAAKLPAWGRIDPRRLARSSDLVGDVLAWTIYVLSIGAAAEIVGLRFLSHVGGGFVEHVPRIAGAILILLVGYVLGRLIRDLVTSLAASAGAARARLLGKFAMSAVFVATVLMAADQAGVNITFLAQLIIVVLGALLFGAALSFALGASSQIANILAAYQIQKIYRVGQRIRIEDHVGRILNISATGVSLATAEGRMFVPARRFSESESVLLPDD